MKYRPLTMIQQSYLKRCAIAPMIMSAVNPSMLELEKRGLVEPTQTDDPARNSWAATEKGKGYFDAA